jgi:hypothetical protein
MKNFRTVALAGLALITATACYTVSVMDQLKTVSAGRTGCTPDQITISNHTGSNINETWNATCNGKVYLCSGVAAGNSTENYSCAPAVE